MSNEPQDKVVHRYDDIEEEDNKLPNWWLFILFATIVFGFGYWLVFHTTKALPDIHTAYVDEVERIKKARAVANPTSDEAIIALAADPAQVVEGKKVFDSTCASCHAASGEGLVGPNLTDKFWLHGNTPGAIVKSVNEGYAEKGMPPWGPILGADKVRKVAAYVVSIKGRNLPGKAPQGEAVE